LSGSPSIHCCPAILERTARASDHALWSSNSARKELRKALDDRGISIHGLTLNTNGQPMEAAACHRNLGANPEVRTPPHSGPNVSRFLLATKCDLLMRAARVTLACVSLLIPCRDGLRSVSVAICFVPTPASSPSRAKLTQIRGMASSDLSPLERSGSPGAVDRDFL
jgi:hypothetical protein